MNISVHNSTTNAQYSQIINEMSQCIRKYEKLFPENCNFKIDSQNNLQVIKWND